MKPNIICFRDIIFHIDKNIRHPWGEVAVMIQKIQKGKISSEHLEAHCLKILEKIISADIQFAIVFHPYDYLLEELPVLRKLSKAE